MGEELTIEEEQRAFDRDLSALLEDHEGRWVLFKGGELVGIHDEEGLAYEAGLRAFGPDQVFLIAKVEPASPRQISVAWQLGLMTHGRTKKGGRRALRSRKDRPGAPMSIAVARSDYPSRDHLARMGPLIKAGCGVPPVLAQALRKAGRAIPDPVNGQMLIDTGAGETAISLDVITELGLNPIRRIPLIGAHGIQERDVYRIGIEIPLMNSDGSVGVARSIRDVVGVPDLEKLTSPTARLDDGSSARVIGLLGREFLKYGHLYYDGHGAAVELWIDLNSMRKTPPPGSEFPSG